MKAFIVARSTGNWDQITYWLQQMSWTVEQSDSCRAAFKIIESNPDIDLVMLDGVGTDGSALPLVRQLRGDHRLGSLPIIMGGAEITSEVVSECMTLGIEDIVVLPTTAETLRSKIHQATRNSRTNILVVDDEPAIRELLADFLTLERFRPVLASNVDEAVKMFEANKIDVVVTDVLMPGKTGLDLLGHVKKVSPTTPVILITGYAGNYTPEKLANLGADGYFAKPFHNMELAYTLRNVLKPRNRTNSASGAPSQGVATQ